MNDSKRRRLIIARLKISNPNSNELRQLIMNKHMSKEHTFFPDDPKNIMLRKGIRRVLGMQKYINSTLKERRK